MTSDTKKNGETQEDFCTACAMIPLAFAGAGTTAYGASSRGSSKKMRTILLWTGVSTALIAFLTIMYVYYIKKNCVECNK
jgi:hypothetical protein